ncbi:Response regulator receiver domain-containing protein [Humidesulfovibrio mexicanus]|uniref:Response regulator receiver domain-containing protein n=1 Tax=Humidesulfovibrio mexicanus TaxID=147047 RepID=A0A238YE61_9BACT|nr:response regulator [Humidesulfovibrio mexicanus]SNR69242.1 Response regulator receiver domain-containing protein [Humidesulfovibrio mexicanus]
MSETIKVLVVDDEERFRNTLGKLLTAHGMTVTVAEGGERAVEILRSTPHDVALLDVKMPGMSGQQTLLELKKIDPDLEVIILTGHASVDIAAEMIAHGGSDYLLKPYPMEELLGIIHIAFDRRKTAKGA